MPAFGALKKFTDSLKQGSVPKDEMRAVGKFFKNIPNEQYFNRATRPATSLNEARDIYGVDIMADPRRPERIFVKPKGTPLEQAHYLLQSNMGDYLRENNAWIEPEDYELFKRFEKNTPVYEITSSESGSGTGSGTRTYPAMMDLLSGVKRSLNVTSGLSGVNELRKPLNVADALKRNPTLNDLIIPNFQQTDRLGMTPLRYATLDPESRIGANLLSGSTGFLRTLEELTPGSTPYQNLYPSAVKAQEALRELGAGADPGAFEAFRIKHAPTSALYGIGVNTAKKMSLIDAILSGKEGELDLPYMTTGLGFKKGGLAQHHSGTCGK